MADPGNSGYRWYIPLDLPLVSRLHEAGLEIHGGARTRRTFDLYDTADRRLAAAGAELSFHHREGWSWRRDPFGNPKLEPRECTAPPGAAAELVAGWSRAYRRGRPLGRRARLCVHSRQYRVHGRGLSAPLTVIEESIADGDGAAATPRLHRVVFLDTTNSEDVTRLQGLLEATAPGHVQTLAALRPSLVRAPRLRLPDADVVSPRALLVRSMTLSTIQWLYFDSELAGPGSPDALRKVRVALRRLRSDLQTFAPMLEPEWAASLRSRLGVLAGELGTVRDAEVLVGRLGELITKLPAEEQADATTLVDTASAQLAAALVELLHRLSLPTYIELLEAPVSAVAPPRWADGAEMESVTSLAARRWRKLRRFVAALDESPGDDELHRVRILAKRVRYASDASVPAVGAAAAASSAAVTNLQTVLGEQHDAVVTRAWLRRQALGSTDLAFVTGELAALELQRSRDSADRWRLAWRAASRRKDWRWLRS